MNRGSLICGALFLLASAAWFFLPLTAVDIACRWVNDHVSVRIFEGTLCALFGVFILLGGRKKK